MTTDWGTELSVCGTVNHKLCWQLIYFTTTLLVSYYKLPQRHLLPQAPEAAGRACQGGLRGDREAPEALVDILHLASDAAHPNGAVPPPCVSSTCLLHNAWKCKPELVSLKYFICLLLAPRRSVSLCHLLYFIEGKCNNRLHKQPIGDHPPCRGSPLLMRHWCIHDSTISTH